MNKHLKLHNLFVLCGDSEQSEGGGSGSCECLDNVTAALAALAEASSGAPVEVKGYWRRRVSFLRKGPNPIHQVVRLLKISWYLRKSVPIVNTPSTSQVIFVNDRLKQLAPPLRAVVGITLGRQWNDVLCAA